MNENIEITGTISSVLPIEADGSGYIIQKLILDKSDGKRYYSINR